MSTVELRLRYLTLSATGALYGSHLDSYPIIPHHSFQSLGYGFFVAFPFGHIYNDKKYTQLIILTFLFLYGINIILVYIYFTMRLNVGAPPPTQMYRCHNSQCLPAGYGVTLAECKTLCPPAPPGQKYRCYNSDCHASSTGGVSIEDCKKLCTPAPTPATRYDCNQAQQVCVIAVPGEFPTINECREVCDASVPPSLPPTKYQCEPISKACVLTTSGYDTIEECKAMSPACHNPQGTFWCDPPSQLCVSGDVAPPGSVSYPTYSACLPFCNPSPGISPGTPPPPPTKKYVCNEMNKRCEFTGYDSGYSLKKCQSSAICPPRYECNNDTKVCDRSTQGSTMEACQQIPPCLPPGSPPAVQMYRCVNGVCTESAQGGVPLNVCQNTCGKSYLCNNGVCILTQHGGEAYDTCIDHCKPSPPPGKPPGGAPGSSDDDDNNWVGWVILGVLILAIVGVLLWTFGVFGSAVAGGGTPYLPGHSLVT